MTRNELLELNKQVTKKQCRKVLLLLIQGKQLTQLAGMVEYGIGDTIKRISELRNRYDIPIQDKWVFTSSGKKYKKYYLELDK